MNEKKSIVAMVLANYKRDKNGMCIVEWKISKNTYKHGYMFFNPKLGE